jgi:FMN phosphatase YigB (HAD superfamily)
MPPSALLFDLENTFFDGTFWHRQLHQMVSRWGRPISFSDFKAAWQFNWLPQVYSGQMEYWQAMSAFLLDLGVEGCARIELLSAAKARLQSAQAGLRPYSGVAEALRELRDQPVFDELRQVVDIGFSAAHRPTTA